MSSDSELAPGVYRIVSLTGEGRSPASVNLTLQGIQNVYLNGPVVMWTLRREGDDILLSAGGYPYTGVEDEMVIATIHSDQNLEWRATYREAQEAYTIEPVRDEGRGWTVVDNSPNASGLLTS